MASVDSYPRESNVLVPLTVSLNGAPLTVSQVGQIELAVHPVGVRPSAWAAPVVILTEYGVMTGGLAAGFYTVWARVTANPETPVIDLGSFRVS